MCDAGVWEGPTGGQQCTPAEATSAETSEQYAIRKAETVKAMQTRNAKKSGRSAKAAVANKGRGGARQMDLSSSATSIIASAAAAVGKPQSDYLSADCVEAVRAVLQATKNQAYATGLAGGAIGRTQSFTAAQTSSLTATLVDKLEIDGADQAEAKIQAIQEVSKAAISETMNRAYATMR